MKHLTELARSLCELRGISGDEARVREFIAGELQGGSAQLSMKTDPLGNLIVVKPGQAPGKKIVLFAHMDEVMFSGFSQQEKDGLNRYLRKMIDNLQRLDGE